MSNKIKIISLACLLGFSGCSKLSLGEKFLWLNTGVLYQQHKYSKDKYYPNEETYLYYESEFEKIILGDFTDSEKRSKLEKIHESLEKYKSEYELRNSPPIVPQPTPPSNELRMPVKRCTSTTV